MNRRDHSIFSEPHLQPADDSRDANSKSPTTQDEPALGAPVDDQSLEERAHHNVWDEPWAREAGLTAPDDAIDYARWYRYKLNALPRDLPWIVCGLLASTGGILAILGTFVSGTLAPYFPIVTIVVVGPIIEEVMKVTAVVTLLERRPYLFPNAAMLFVTAAASAATFAAVENLLYINVYIEAPTPSLIRWRWTVCTAMHIGATLIAALGLRQMWKKSRANFSKPTMADAYPFVVLAAVFHGAYNLSVVLYEGFGEPF